jgi:hypothetical protein
MRQCQNERYTTLREVLCLRQVGEEHDMTKALLVLGFIGTVFFAAHPERENLSRLKRVEAYEVRPGIVALPRYTADGQICEIVLEKLHHLATAIRLDPTLTSTEVDQIADQLVPSDERGPKPKGLLEQGIDSLVGNSMETSEEYQNISIHTYRAIVGSPAKDRISVGDIAAATIKWKHRTCRAADGHDDK